LTNFALLAEKCEVHLGKNELVQEIFPCSLRELFALAYGFSRSCIAPGKPGLSANRWIEVNGRNQKLSFLGEVETLFQGTVFIRLHHGDFPLVSRISAHFTLSGDSIPEFF